MTYNGTVPGPLVVCHQDDYVELTLKNPSASVTEHNIDFHASTGGARGRSADPCPARPGDVLRFKATKPGVFVYHCAPGGVMIPYHVVHGMSGTIMVLPREGLTDGKGNPLRYDRVYYVGGAGLLHPEGRERQLEGLRRTPCRTSPTSFRS